MVDLQALQEVTGLIKDEMLRMPGVVGIGFGMHYVGDLPTNDLAIRVFVQKDRLGESQIQQIPRVVQGIPVDVLGVVMRAGDRGYIFDDIVSPTLRSYILIGVKEGGGGVIFVNGRPVRRPPPLPWRSIAERLINAVPQRLVNAVPQRLMRWMEELREDGGGDVGF